MGCHAGRSLQAVLRSTVREPDMSSLNDCARFCRTSLKRQRRSFAGASGLCGRFPHGDSGFALRLIGGTILLWLFPSLAPTLAAAVLTEGFHQTRIASGINGATAMEIAPDGRLFVCEQTGA